MDMLNDEQFKLLRAKADSYGLSESSWKRAECATDLLNFVNTILAAERERVIEMCAAVCDRRAEDYHMSGHTNRADATEIAASEIRALKGK